MQYFNLLGTPEKLVRDVSIRTKNKEINRLKALKFDFDYFDGSRESGYGGYTYDGRWVAVAEKLIDRYQLTGASKFLDVGCAKGFLLHDLYIGCTGIELAGVDVSEYAKKIAPETIRNTINLTSCDELPFPNDYFDASVAINTVHNLDASRCLTAIKELVRVTKNKKNIFIQVDAYHNDQERELFEQWMLTAKTYLKPQQWIEMFKAANYQGDFFWTTISFANSICHELPTGQR